MHSSQSFLIASSDKNLASLYLSEFFQEKGINSLDINWQIHEKTMGIKDVRDIQKTISLKPFRGKIKAVVFDCYENITTEAQSALLKILEEPPVNTFVIISVTKKDLILPTIISRCKVITLKEKKTAIIANDASMLRDNLDILLKGKTGDKLRLAEIVTVSREETLLWLRKMTVFMRGKLTEGNNNLEYLNFLKELQETYGIIKSTNVSQRTSLENLFLSL